MDWTGCKYVESVPDRLSGTPVLIHSRMPADGVLENFDDDVSPEDIAAEFSVELARVIGVLIFAGGLKQIAA